MKTIKDIAALANVSIGTVDRVIHNRSGVSKKTKERIEKIIQEHNFQINKTARTLALNKKYDIAVLIPAIESSSDFWYLPKKGIEKASKEIEIHRTSVSYFYFNQFDSNSFKEAFDKLLEKTFDAVLLAPVFLIETKKRLIQLEQRKTPYVFINVELQGANNISYIGQHSFDSGTLAAKLMSLLIHDNDEVLIVKVRKDNSHHSAIEDRISGFKSYFNTQASSIKINEVVLPKTKDQIAIDTFIYKTLANQHIKGLFVPSSKVSIMAKYIEEHRLKHLKLIGYDLSEENALFIKNETINFLIDQNAFFQGYEGTKTLFNFIINDIVPKKNRYLPIKLLTKENIKYL
ncbi:LacI family DNA-binding transcriptional regulator [Flavivirga spongiicola]|uniref:LacI family DNA-binding transcriptional regulator n=1 Tax=Flavivirga spongiicola TaxID=421621 RepID=A0ABU7XLW5_9FLAO|nr:LacI family DNA-binding transcriptional regulator [Flavivirga sp. MEBiC05379]MDO5981403.1 LacI family DNA-binding transcriptional regulator [Flavivirga sp. MEBiC05379]